MIRAFKSSFAVLALVTIVIAPEIRAQDHIKISGLAYLDYSYTLSSPDDDAVGDNGFGYRRLYLTTDYTLSETFSGRARLEANDRSTTQQGRPAPFVKDLYLKWNNFLGAGHELVIGISAPPSFTVVEKLWGYRSLVKMLMDRNKIVASRDFGVALRGNLSQDGSLRYGLMASNNSSVMGETNKHKRLYGQVEWYPTDAIQVTLGGDYADYRGERDNALNGNVMVGYKSDKVRFGVEGFYSRINLTRERTNNIAGLSFFGAAPVSDSWELVGRFDNVTNMIAGMDSNEQFIIVGAAYQPHEKIFIIPNIVVVRDPDEDTPYTAGRVTVHLNF